MESENKTKKRMKKKKKAEEIEDTIYIKKRMN